MHWYAAKARQHQSPKIAAELKAEAVEHFVPSMIPSLVFLRCDEAYLASFEQAHFQQLWIYRDPLTRKPSAIPEREMEVFMFVCTAGQQGLTYLGDDKAEYHQGDRVRVTSGPFKGAEGHIKRIKKDRRLVVTIRGVAAVATAYIHPDFLEIVHS